MHVAHADEIFRLPCMRPCRWLAWAPPLPPLKLLDLMCYNFFSRRVQPDMCFFLKIPTTYMFQCDHSAYLSVSQFQSIRSILGSECLEEGKNISCYEINITTHIGHTTKKCYNSLTSYMLRENVTTQLSHRSCAMLLFL